MRFGSKARLSIGSDNCLTENTCVSAFSWCDLLGGSTGSEGEEGGSDIDGVDITRMTHTAYDQNKTPPNPRKIPHNAGNPLPPGPRCYPHSFARCSDPGSQVRMGKTTDTKRFKTKIKLQPV